MAIETLIDLPPGDELAFRLRRHARSMELRGWIRWCKLVRTISTSAGKELTVFHSGVEFDDATIEVVRRSSGALTLQGEIEEGTAEGTRGVQSPGQG